MVQGARPLSAGWGLLPELVVGLTLAADCSGQLVERALAEDCLALLVVLEQAVLRAGCLELRE